MYTKGSLVICADTSLYKKDKAKIIERHYWDVIGQHINTIFGIAMVWALYWAYYFSRIFLLVKIFAHDLEHLQYKQSSRNKTQQHEACDVDISSQWNISCACHSRPYSVRMTCPKRPSFQSEPWKELIKLHLYSALVCYFFVLNNLQLVSILFPASRGLSRQGIYFIEIVTVNCSQGHGYEC